MNRIAPSRSTANDDSSSSARFRSSAARLFRNVLPGRRGLERKQRLLTRSVSWQFAPGSRGAPPPRRQEDTTTTPPRVSFALDKNGKVPRRNVCTYEAPPRAEHPMLFYTKEELTRMSESCDVLAKENKDNQEYLRNLGRIALLDNDVGRSGAAPEEDATQEVPGAEPLSGEETSSLDSSLSSVILGDASCLPESEALEHMRGLEHLLEEKAGAQRRWWVQSLLRYQEKLNRKADVCREERAARLCRKSKKFSRDSTSLARNLAEWDALEAARVHHHHHRPNRTSRDDNKTLMAEERRCSF